MTVIASKTLSKELEDTICLFISQKPDDEELT